MVAACEITGFEGLEMLSLVLANAEAKLLPPQLEIGRIVVDRIQGQGRRDRDYSHRFKGLPELRNMFGESGKLQLDLGQIDPPSALLARSREGTKCLQGALLRFREGLSPTTSMES